jgi:hypothetical protein
MLTCIYHPTNGMQVLEECEAEALIKSGFWFDSPKDAANYRNRVEEEIKQSRKVGRPKRVKEE